MRNTFTPVIDRYRRLQKIIPQSYIGNHDPQLLLIDMGHGGLNKKEGYVTAGKQAEHPGFIFFEGVWTRSVGWTLAQELYHSGRNYAVLTGTDKDISLSHRVMGVHRAAEEAKVFGKKIYVMSIHGNAFSDGKVNGVEIFTSPNHTQSDPIATIYFNELKRLGWRMRPGDKDLSKEARFTMLTGPEKLGIPAILPEIGFYTNEEQAIEMCQLETIDKIAELLRDADVKLNDLKIFK